MAQRRMISPKIIDTDDFMDMPASTQALYFHMLLRADDDGFLGNPKRIVRFCGAADDDLKVLVAKRFIIPFESGVCVIRHWRVHNLIRADRYHETFFKVEKESLNVDHNGTYETDNQMATKWQPNAAKLATEVRLGKDSLGKDKKEKSNTSVPAKADTTLYHFVEDTFLKVQPNNRFVSYPKEGSAIKKLISEAEAREPSDPQSWLVQVLGAFADLRQSGDKFWKSQPVLPSIVASSGILPRILEHIREDSIDNYSFDEVLW